MATENPEEPRLAEKLQEFLKAWGLRAVVEAAEAGRLLTGNNVGRLLKVELELRGASQVMRLMDLGMEAERGDAHMTDWTKERGSLWDVAPVVTARRNLEALEEELHRERIRVLRATAERLERENARHRYNEPFLTPATVASREASSPASVGRLTLADE